MNQQKHDLIKSMETILNLLPEDRQEAYGHYIIDMENSFYSILRNPTLHTNPIYQFADELENEFGENSPIVTEVNHNIGGMYKQYQEFSKVFNYQDMPDGLAKLNAAKECAIYDFEVTLSYCNFPDSLKQNYLKMADNLREQDLKDIFVSEIIPKTYEAIDNAETQDSLAKGVSYDSSSKYATIFDECKDFAQDIAMYQLYEALDNSAKDYFVESEVENTSVEQDAYSFEENLEVTNDKEYLLMEFQEGIHNGIVDTEFMFSLNQMYAKEQQKQTDVDIESQETQVQDEIDLLEEIIEEPEVETIENAIDEELEDISEPVAVEDSKMDKAQMKEMLKSKKAELKEVKEELHDINHTLKLHEKLLKSKGLDAESQVFADIQESMTALYKQKKALTEKASKLHDKIKEYQHELALAPIKNLRNGYLIVAEQIDVQTEGLRNNLANQVTTFKNVTRSNMELSIEAIKSWAQNINTQAQAGISKIKINANLSLAKRLQPAINHCKKILAKIEKRQEKAVGKLQAKIDKLETKTGRSHLDAWNQSKAEALKIKLTELKSGFEAELKECLDTVKKEIPKYNKCRQTLKDDRNQTRQAIVDFMNKNRFRIGMQAVENYIEQKTGNKVDKVDISMVKSTNYDGKNLVYEALMNAQPVSLEAEAMAQLTRLAECGLVNSQVAEEVMTQIVRSDKEKNLDFVVTNANHDKMKEFISFAEESLKNHEKNALKSDYRHLGQEYGDVAEFVSKFSNKSIRGKDFKTVSKGIENIAKRSDWNQGR